MQRPTLSIDRLVLAFAGAMVLLGSILTASVSPKFLLLTGFVGANMVQSAFTRFCPLARILKRTGCRTGAAFE